MDRDVPRVLPFLWYGSNLLVIQEEYRDYCHNWTRLPTRPPAVEEETLDRGNANDGLTQTRMEILSNDSYSSSCHSEVSDVVVP